MVQDNPFSSKGSAIVAEAAGMSKQEIDEMDSDDHDDAVADAEDELSFDVDSMAYELQEQVDEHHELRLDLAYGDLNEYDSIAALRKLHLDTIAVDPLPSIDELGFDEWRRRCSGLCLDTIARDVTSDRLIAMTVLEKRFVWRADHAKSFADARRWNDALVPLRRHLVALRHDAAVRSRAGALSSSSFSSSSSSGAALSADPALLDDLEYDRPCPCADCELTALKNRVLEAARALSGVYQETYETSSLTEEYDLAVFDGLTAADDMCSPLERAIQSLHLTLQPSSAVLVTDLLVELANTFASARATDTSIGSANASIAADKTPIGDANTSIDRVVADLDDNGQEWMAPLRRAADRGLAAAAVWRSAFQAQRQRQPSKPVSREAQDAILDACSAAAAHPVASS